MQHLVPFTCYVTSVYTFKHCIDWRIEGPGPGLCQPWKTASSSAWWASPSSKHASACNVSISVIFSKDLFVLKHCFQLRCKWILSTVRKTMAMYTNTTSLRKVNEENKTFFIFKIFWMDTILFLTDYIFAVTYYFSQSYSTTVLIM